MEVWKEYRKGEIPKGNYKAEVICGDSDGLRIELRSKENRLVLDFGICDAVRIVERKFLDMGLYENIETLKKDNFSNVIYEVENGQYLNEIKLYSGGLFDDPYTKQYTVITENLYIDTIYDGEPENPFLERIYKLD